MSNFFNPPTLKKSKLNTTCMYCNQEIKKGEIYTYQKGNFEGFWQETKMHPECFENMENLAVGEYLPYDNERPLLIKNNIKEKDKCLVQN